jgi:hypothetical protein
MGHHATAFESCQVTVEWATREHRLHAFKLCFQQQVACVTAYFETSIFNIKNTILIATLCEFINRETMVD